MGEGAPMEDVAMPEGGNGKGTHRLHNGGDSRVSGPDLSRNFFSGRRRLNKSRMMGDTYLSNKLAEITNRIQSPIREERLNLPMAENASRKTHSGGGAPPRGGPTGLVPRLCGPTRPLGARARLMACPT